MISKDIEDKLLANSVLRHNEDSVLYFIEPIEEYMKNNKITNVDKGIEAFYKSVGRSISE